MVDTIRTGGRLIFGRALARARLLGSAAPGSTGVGVGVSESGPANSSRPGPSSPPSMFAKSGAGTCSRPRPGSGNRFCPPARRSTSDWSSGKSSARSSRTRSRSRSSRSMRGRASAPDAFPHAASCCDTTSWIALRYARYVAPRVPVRMKSFLLKVRHAARSGTSINPLMCGVGGLMPSQSQPRLMTFPKVLMATPCRSASRKV